MFLKFSVALIIAVPFIAHADDPFANPFANAPSLQRQEDGVLAGRKADSADKAADTAQDGTANPGKEAAANQESAQESLQEAEPKSKNNDNVQLVKSRETAPSETESTVSAPVSGEETVSSEKLMADIDNAVGESKQKYPKRKVFAGNSNASTASTNESLTDEDPAPVAPPSTSDRVAAKEDQISDLEIGNEVDEANFDGDLAIQSEQRREDQRVRKDIAKLERDARNAQSRDLRARKTLELQAKRLELTQREAREKQNLLTSAKHRQKQSETEVAQLHHKVDTVKNRLRVAQENNSTVKDAITEIQKKNVQLAKKLKVAQLKLEKERLQMKHLREKRQQALNKQRELKRRLSVANGDD